MADRTTTPVPAQTPTPKTSPGSNAGQAPGVGAHVVVVGVLADKSAACRGDVRIDVEGAADEAAGAAAAVEGAAGGRRARRIFHRLCRCPSGCGLSCVCAGLI